MAETKLEKMLDAALAQRFVPFEDNTKRNDALLKLHTSALRKIWEYEDTCGKIEAKLIASDVVQQGKNEGARKALLELEKGKVPDFDILRDWKRVLSFVFVVQDYNDRFIKIVSLKGE